VLEQLAKPLGVLDIGLSTGHVLHVLGVDQPKLEVVFEQVVDRLPVAGSAAVRSAEVP